MLVLASGHADCRFRGTVGSIARIANVTVEECRLALDTLSSPDPGSHSKKEDGRRVIEVEDGIWWVVNLQEFRDRKSDSPWALYKAKKRAEAKTQHGEQK